MFIAIKMLQFVFFKYFICLYLWIVRMGTTSYILLYKYNFLRIYYLYVYFDCLFALKFWVAASKMRPGEIL